MNQPPTSRRYDAHTYVPSRRLADMPELQDALEHLIAENRRGQARRRRSGQSGKASELLGLSVRRPCVPVARLWETLGIPAPSTQAKVRKELEDGLLAEFAEERFGRRNVLLISPTHSGYELEGQEPPRRTGRGGIVHRHIVAWIKTWLVAQGYDANTEVVVPGTSHPADVAYETDNGMLVVYEVVVTSDDNVADHLNACFIQSAAISTVTIVAPRKSMLKQIEKAIRAEPSLASFLHRVSYEPAETFLEAVS